LAAAPAAPSTQPARQTSDTASVPSQTRDPCQPSGHHGWHTRRSATCAPFGNPTGMEIAKMARHCQMVRVWVIWKPCRARLSWLADANAAVATATSLSAVASARRCLMRAAWQPRRRKPGRVVAPTSRLVRAPRYDRAARGRGGAWQPGAGDRGVRRPDAPHL
jgi:hypothetical protein